MRPAIALLLATAGLAAPASAQVVNQSEIPLSDRGEELPIRFDNLNLEQGLSQTTVYAIAQDRGGFMWFGTQRGLDRFDGTRIETIRSDPFDSTSILDDYVRTIVSDEDGTLWLGYQDGSVSRFDPSTGIARNFRSNTRDTTALFGGETHGILREDDHLWVMTTNPDIGGVQRLNLDTGHVTRYGTGEWNGGAIGPAGAILRDRQGRLVIAGRDGVFRFDPEIPRFERIATDAIFLNRATPDADDPDVVWAGSPGGVVQLNLESGEVRRIDITDGDGDVVLGVAADPSDPDVLWAGTLEGLVRMHRSSGARFTYRADPAVAHSLPANTIIGLYRDRAGILWASNATAGVSRFDPTAIGFTRYREERDGLDTFRGLVAWSIEATQSPVIWVAARNTRYGAPSWFLNRIDRRTGRTRAWRTSAVDRAPLLVDRRNRVWWGASPRNLVRERSGLLRYDEGTDDLVAVLSAASGTLPNDQIYGIEEGRDGRLWILTDGGLVRYDPDTGERRSWLPDPADPSSLEDGRIRHVLEDTASNMWVSTVTGLAVIRPGSDTVERIDEREDAASWLEDAYPRFPVLDRAGRLWWAAAKPGRPSAIVVYDPKIDRFSGYAHDPADRASWHGMTPQGLLPDPDNADILWAGAYGGGISRLDVETGSFRHYGVADGLTTPDVYGPVLDDEGTVWIATNSGIFSMDRATGRFTRYGLEYGLQSLEFNGGAVARSPSGELFFGGIDGVNSFFPTQLRSNPVPPEVVLTELVLDNAVVRPGEGSPLKRALADTDELRLAYSRNSPTFRFAALHYKRPQSNRVRYRLEPLQADWIDAGEAREALYTELAPGEYTFRVVAANSDGVWNEAGASLRVVVLPPWWRTWWAYLLYAAVVALGVMAVDRIQRARIARRQADETHEIERAHAKEIEEAFHQLRQTKEQLVQQEKLASLGSLTAGIAHEIKNPLNFVNNFAEVNAELAGEAREALASGDVEAARQALADLEDNAAQIAKHGKRADSIVRSMMQHARGGTSEKETVDVNAFLEEYAALAWHGMRARDDGFKAELARDFAEDAGTIVAMPQELGRVVLNLLGNAFDATRSVEAARVTIGSRRTAEGVEITVSDNGPGIPADIREKIFEPFFTTKPTGEGTGLGLSLSYDIVTKGHGGTMTVGESAYGGAEFRIELPA